MRLGWLCNSIFIKTLKSLQLPVLGPVKRLVKVDLAKVINQLDILLIIVQLNAQLTHCINATAKELAILANANGEPVARVDCGQLMLY